MKVLHVVPTFYPATYWGGPIFSTKAICDGIAALSHVDLRVLTADAAGPAVSDRVAPVALPYPVSYTRRWAGNCMAPGLLARLPGAIAWADVVHLTGTYNMTTLPVLALSRAMGKPVVWSPRGALLATADWDETPKRRLKHAFERLAALLHGPDTVLHVTSEAEAERSIRRLSNINTVVIPNAVDLPELPPTQKTGRRLMFLSRLHPKKGLEELLRAMGRLPQDISLDIYGAGDAGYCDHLLRMAGPFGQRVQFHGHVEGAAKTQAFARADLFVLPSHSENFGIVVAEALAHAVPVLTTDRTPWAEVDRQGCGRCIRLDGADLAAEIAGLLQRDLPVMGRLGRQWMARDFAPSQMVDRFETLYRLMAGQPWEAAPA